MLVRFVSSVVGLPVLAVFVVLGGLPLRAALAAVALVGMTEVYTALAGRVTPAHIVSCVCAAAYFLLLDAGRALTLVMAVFVIALSVCLVAFHERMTAADCAAAIFGFVYAAFPLSFIWLTRAHNEGAALVWLIFIGAWGSDTCAYLVGRAVGRHKLTPKLSPNKTVEGAVGGVLGAMLIGCAYGWLRGALGEAAAQGLRGVALFTLVAGLGAVFSQFGDLAASAIKRYTNIKDFGKIIPGHGGVLDRFDSVLLTAPGVYLAICLLFRS